MRKMIALLFICFFCSPVFAQQGVGINTDGSLPHSSAMLDVISNNKGMLVPCVSLLSPTDVVTITSPTNGLLVFNTNTDKNEMPDGEGFYYWDKNLTY